MKSDPYTKLVLSAIALFLGLLVLAQTKSSTARGDDASGTIAPFQDWQMTGTMAGITAFNSKTGDIYLYAYDGGRWDRPIHGKLVTMGNPVQ